MSKGLLHASQGSPRLVVVVVVVFAAADVFLLSTIVPDAAGDGSFGLHPVDVGVPRRAYVPMLLS